jgi:hypothetical protein
MVSVLVAVMMIVQVIPLAATAETTNTVQEGQTYTISNYENGKFLKVSELADCGPGTITNTWTEDGTSGQRWTAHQGNSGWMFSPESGSECSLNVWAQTVFDGAEMKLWNTDTTDLCQNWILKYEAEMDAYLIVSAGDQNLVLTATGLADGSKVLLNTFCGSDLQYWKINSTGEEQNGITEQEGTSDNSALVDPLLLNCREVYTGYEAIYIVTTNNAPIRSTPYKTGQKLATLQEGDVLLCKGLYVNSKSNYWIKTETSDGVVGYIFTGNLTEHTSHDLFSLQDVGFAGYAFCRVCGYVKATTCPGRIDADEDTDLLKIHVALAVLSFAPVVGNVFDVIDGLISLGEGDYFSAALSLVAAVPAVGTIADAIKGEKISSKVIDISSDTAVLIERIDDTSDAIRISEAANSQKLARRMLKKFKETGCKC